MSLSRGDRAGGRAQHAPGSELVHAAPPARTPMDDSTALHTTQPEAAGYNGPDRRSRPTPRISRYSFLGGRRTVVNGEEREGSYVDVYGTWLFATIAWVSLMNVADSFFTLYHLQAGGIELNPIAQGLLNLGRVDFVLWKSVMISLALLVLCVHKNFGLARWGLVAATATYTTLFGWHLYLLTV
jgi:uncharacterized protein DUF5658